MPRKLQLASAGHGRNHDGYFGPDGRKKADLPGADRGLRKGSLPPVDAHPARIAEGFFTRQKESGGGAPTGSEVPGHAGKRNQNNLEGGMEQLCAERKIAA